MQKQIYLLGITSVISKGMRIRHVVKKPKKYKIREVFVQAKAKKRVYLPEKS